MKQEDMETIQCQPQKQSTKDYFLLAILNIVPAGLMFSLFFISSELITDFKTPGSLKIFFMILGYILSALLYYYFYNWERERWYWKLTESELINGKRKLKSYRLSDINKIIKGLPHKTNLVISANKFLNPQIYQGTLIDRALCLLIKFEDGSMLPFHVHRCFNGTNLMNQLVALKSNLVVQDYFYSEEEINLLKKADWNKLIKVRIS
jgi:hypothetical protein